MALLLERCEDGINVDVRDCVDGKFTFGDGLELTILEARQLARVSVNEVRQADLHRAWTLRVVGTRVST